MKKKLTNEDTKGPWTQAGPKSASQACCANVSLLRNHVQLIEIIVLYLPFGSIGGANPSRIFSCSSF